MPNQKYLLAPAACLFFILVWSCGQKKKNEFFPVQSFIASQVKDVDTSLYPIIRADKRDSLWDTTYVKRDEFRALAVDFLETPDLTKSSIGKKYKEDKIYDPGMDRAMLTYTPIKDNVEVDREEVVIIPDPTGNGKDRVRSIVIQKTKETNDSTIIKHLLWQVDEKFQVVTIVEKNGEAVSTRTMEVSWKKNM